MIDIYVRQMQCYIYLLFYTIDHAISNHLIVDQNPAGHDDHLSGQITPSHKPDGGT